MQGRELGFDGKTLIHPGQVEPCNAAFAPERGRGRGGARHHRSLGRRGAGAGVVTVDGRMIENLHVDNARRVLATDAAIRALEQESAG